MRLLGFPYSVSYRPKEKVVVERKVLVQNIYIVVSSMNDGMLLYSNLLLAAFKTEELVSIKFLNQN